MRTLCALALLGLGATGVATLGGFQGRYFWFFDLMSHFRVQYLWILLLVALPLAARRMWRWTGVALLILAINLIVVLPISFSSPKPSANEEGALSILVFNVNSENKSMARVAKYVAHKAPDVVVILEATREIRILLEGPLPDYEVIDETREDSFGILVLSRIPLRSQKVMYLGDSNLPAIQFEIEKEGTPYSILAVHTMPPVGGERSAIRNRMLADAASWARGKANALIVGDLNATPWSHAFRDLLEEGQLINSQCGFGVQGSWPTGLWAFAIPIDHALHGPALTTTKRALGPFLGSDHRPLLLRVGASLDRALDGGQPPG